ncbi:MAG: asparagine synthase (glutamine-hydrolyzing), partial [Candidatus Nanoarchaeia archaeon]
MCGIAGIAKFNGQEVFEQELAPMNDALSHRGPDGQGIKIVGNAGLAHRRLSIIDLESGAQPMCNEDGSIWISFNGEIYNFREIRKYLISKGHIFKTNSDTEAIIHLYEELGEECPSKLNGMFAFAILDTRKKKIFLARDRLGQKPLFYFCDSAKFAFASELQALMKLPGIPRDIDFQSFHDYLSLQYVPSPKTIYHSIFKLLPAHTITVDIENCKINFSRYWKCRYDNKRNLSFESAKEELRYLVEDSVRLRMISDVPIGAFLSGGLDSSIICALMSKLSNQPIRTFTIGFEETIYDERIPARNVSAKFKTSHNEKIVNPKDFAVVEMLVKHYGEPYSDSSMLPTYMLSKFARENVKVALSGDGADEIFTGYYRYLVMKYANFADAIPLPLRKAISEILLSLLKKGESERTISGKL